MTKTLGSSRPAFSCVLGAWGRGVSAGGGDDGGADVVYAAHVDGGLSVWVRTPGGFVDDRLIISAVFALVHADNLCG